MPIANIVVNVNSPLGPILKSLQAQAYGTRNLAKQLLELANQQTDGTTFTALESQFGLAAGNGQTVYNLLAGLAGTSGLEAANVVQFCSRLD